MTAINIASSIIYTKDASAREKIQAFLLAGFFLVLLYDSPSGLVFYWVLNQIFSLCKNIVVEFKRPYLFILVFMYFLLGFACFYLAFFKSETSMKNKIIVYFISIIIACIPIVSYILRSKNITQIKEVINTKSDFIIFILSCFVLWILCGLVLPSSVIASSPMEFSYIGNTDSPFEYIKSTSLFFFGLFILWPLIIYKLYNQKVKYCMTIVFFVIALTSILNAYLFKYDYGNVSIFFSIDNPLVLRNTSFFFSFLPIFMCVFIFGVFFVLKQKKLEKYLSTFLCAIILGLLLITFFKSASIHKGYTVATDKRNESKIGDGNIKKNFSLSRNAPNVMVLFFDRAISYFYPCVLEQYPELQKSFEGFIYFPNCVTTTQSTLSAYPPMVGGYEYTLENMNKRKTELLKDKHNEALMVMPKLFSDGGYETYLVNPTYLDHLSGEIPEIFNSTNVIYPSSDARIKYMKEHSRDFGGINDNDEICFKTSKQFVLMEILYPPIRNVFSNRTKYYYDGKPNVTNDLFISEFANLFYLSDSIEIKDEQPTFVFVGNDITHEYMVLREEYVPGVIDENHPAAGTGIYEWKENTPIGFNDFEAYHANAAMLLQVGKFLDWLKKEDIYDNTRIIIVSDHGFTCELPVFESFGLENRNKVSLNPLLLFKDFNALGGITISDSFMTNVETVNLARDRLPLSDRNPYTGNLFLSVKDFERVDVWRPNEITPDNVHNKTQFTYKESWIVQDNIFDQKNWRKIK